MKNEYNKKGPEGPYSAQSCKPGSVSTNAFLSFIYAAYPPETREQRLYPVYMALQPKRFTPTSCRQPVSCALTTRFHPYSINIER